MIPSSIEGMLEGFRPSNKGVLEGLSNLKGFLVGLFPKPNGLLRISFGIGFLLGPNLKKGFFGKPLLVNGLFVGLLLGIGFWPGPFLKKFSLGSFSCGSG